MTLNECAFPLAAVQKKQKTFSHTLLGVWFQYMYVAGRMWFGLAWLPVVCENSHSCLAQVDASQ